MKKRKVPSLNEIEDRIDELVPASEESRAIALGLIAGARAKKDGVINTRVNQSDLNKLKAIADDQGVKYQTLLGKLIHDYVEGRLTTLELSSHEIASKLWKLIKKDGFPERPTLKGEKTPASMLAMKRGRATSHTAYKTARKSSKR